MSSIFVLLYETPQYKRVAQGTVFHRAVDEGTSGLASVFAEPHFIGRYIPTSYFLDRRLYQKEPQDFGTTGLASVSPEPHFIGHYTATVYRRPIVSTSIDIPPTFETNVHFIGKYTPASYLNDKRLYQKEPQDFGTTGLASVSPEPHFIGRYTSVVYRRPIVSTSIDIPATFETNVHFLGKYIPVNYFSDRRLYQKEPQDFGTTGLASVSPEPHFIGRYTTTVYNRLVVATSIDFSLVVPDTNLHFIGKYVPVNYFNDRRLYQKEPQDFGTTGLASVSPEPHFIGRYTATVYRQPLVSTSIDLPPTFETNIHFLGKYIPASYLNDRRLYQKEPQDFSTPSLQPETNINTLGRYTPTNFFLDLNLRHVPATDFIFVPPPAVVTFYNRPFIRNMGWMGAVLPPQTTAIVGTASPFVNNVDFPAPTLPVVAGQVIGTVTSTNPVSSWTLVADSSTTLNQGGTPGLPFFSIDNTGTIRVTAAGASSGTNIGYQGEATVLTLSCTNSLGTSPADSGYATIGIPVQTVGPRAGLAFPGPCSVGYYNEPGFFTASNPNGPGKFTVNNSFSPSFPNGTPGNPTIVMYVDFDNGGDGVAITGHDIHFIGCRFQSRDPTSGRSALALSGATRLTFSYCSFIPYISLSPHPIPMKSWPSSGCWQPLSPAFEDTDPTMAGKLAVYMCPAANSAQFKVQDSSGGCTFEFCDMWGFGNCYVYNGPINSDQAVIQHSWLHDARLDATFQDHTDFIGYLGNPPTIPIQNMTIQYNTLGGFGGQDMIAWQSGTGNMTNMHLVGNYLDGDGNNTKWPETIGITYSNCSVTDNVYGGTFNIVGALILNGTAIASPGCVWRRNKWHWVRYNERGQSGQQFPGNQYDWGGHGGTQGGSLVDGQFILPNPVPNSGLGGGSPSTTDYTG